jgi:hypothetical protein
MLRRVTKEPSRRRFQHLINTAVKDDACAVCRRPIWSAYDGGTLVKAEKTLIASADELQILLQGRRTYTRQPWGGLLYRHAAEIAAGLRPGETIHQQHHCKGKNR